MTTGTPAVHESAATAADFDVRRQMVQFMVQRANAGHWRRSRHQGAGRLRTPALAMPCGRYLHCPNGSHVTLYGGPATGIAAPMDCLRAVDGAAAE
jgi:hypothetical protein